MRIIWVIKIITNLIVIQLFNYLVIDSTSRDKLRLEITALFLSSLSAVRLNSLQNIPVCFFNCLIGASEDSSKVLFRSSARRRPIGTNSGGSLGIILSLFPDFVEQNDRNGTEVEAHHSHSTIHALYSRSLL